MKPAVRKLMLVALAAGAIAVATFATVGVRAKSEGGAAQPARSAELEFLGSDLITVEALPLEASLALTGNLSPLVEATVKAKVVGELVEVTVREGQSVRRGQVLARIDPTEVRARVAGRSADLEAARAQLELAEKNRATQKTLLDKGYISQNAFDATDSSRDVASARLRAAQAELAVARKSLGDAVLHAPFSGVVSQRHAEPGERVALDARIISLVDLSRLELAAAIPASAIAQVRVGQKLSFRVDGYGDRQFDGHIERINPATVAGSRSINVYAVIDNRDRALRAGLFAQGSLSLARHDDALSVPVSALREQAGQTYVYAIVDGAVRKKAVRVGPTGDAGMAQVLEGLAAGERVVKINLGNLREGALARVANEQANATR
ncbi:MAG: efflux RND transporter periplasmic adaptor subunit [Betaproteobacteria bacterium]|nr:efflux RND transporter periplasmic adaptor subunit [Betaproteobacteria bacterium]